MAWRLTWHANCLSHLTVYRGVGAILVATVLVGGALSLVVSLALRFLLLLLCLPFLPDLLELCTGLVNT